jgi:hypothetical protein
LGQNDELRYLFLQLFDLVIVLSPFKRFVDPFVALGHVENGILENGILEYGLVESWGSESTDCIVCRKIFISKKMPTYQFGKLTLYNKRNI